MVDGCDQVGAMSAQGKVALLGPQHTVPTLRSVLDEAAMPGPYVLVAAGWEEREAETSALESHLGVPVQNLGAWPACESAFEQDPGLQQIMFARHDRMRELNRVYQLRLSAELKSLRELLSGTDPAAPNDLVGPALEPAFEALQALDAHHRGRVARLTDDTFEEAWKSEALKKDTDRMAAMLEGAGTLLVAGGHVGILYNRMRLFRVLEALRPGAAVAGWSAGAMVLTDTLLLFHDSPPGAPGDACVHGPGFGLAKGITALPHASTRLRLDDAARVSILARRLAPSLVIALDDGQSATQSGGGEWSFGPGTKRLLPSGELSPVSAIEEVGA